MPRFLHWMALATLCAGPAVAETSEDADSKTLPPRPPRPVAMAPT